MKLIPRYVRLSQISKVLLQVLILGLIFNTVSFASGYYFDEGEVIKINPDYKIKRYSNGNVIAYKAAADGEKVTYNFTDINGDILVAALRKQKLSSVMFYLSRKYELSEMECRRRIKHSLNVLEEWGIIVKRDKLVLKQDL